MKIGQENTHDMTTRHLARALGSVAAIALIAACATDVDPGAPIAPTAAILSPDTAGQRTPDVPAGQLPDGVTPTAYRLDLRTDPSAEGFSGTVEIDVFLDGPTALIYLHALGPVISQAMATLPDGTVRKADFAGDLAPGGVSSLSFADSLPNGPVTLTLAYEAPYNLGLAGLYKASQGGDDYLATQMEPIDARRAFPSFDEPRFKTPWTVTVTAPAGHKVVANAPEVLATDLGDGWVRHEFAPTRPIQSYLVALAVGPYDVLVADSIPANGIRDEPVPLRAFAVKGKGEKLAEATESTYELLRIQEEYFDYPYPYTKLDLIAAADFAYGAMENAGAIIYREAALLIDERTSLARKRGILSTHAHELAHQWFGNLVTPAWWDDIWLNEAFATWMSAKTMHAYDPEGGFDRASTQGGVGVMGADSLASTRQIRNPINSNGDILSAFDGITYSKGGHVLSMFENYLGEDAFRAGMRLHMRRFEDGVADVNDFMQSLADGSGNAGVVEAFGTFIFQPGVPYLNVTASCPAGEGASVTVTQERYAPLGSAIDPAALWQVPFAMDVSVNGEVSTMTTLLTGRTMAIPVPGGCPDWVMPNADGKGYWRFATSDANWQALTDGFEGLSGGEQIIFADSLVAGFRAGDVPAEKLLAGLKATPAGEWDAASEPLGDLPALVSILPDEAKPAMRAWVGETYRPLYDSLSARGDLSQGETLLMQRVYASLVGVARDEALRADILGRAKAYVGLGGEADPNALSPAELGTGMQVGVEEGGSAFFEAALALGQASDNQTERGAIFGALAGSGGADDVTALLGAAMGEAFLGQEGLFIYYGALGNEDPAVKAAAWDLFKSNFDTLLGRVPEIRKPQMAGAAGAFCTNAETDAAEAFILSKADLIPGYERPLAQAVEGARLCAALKEAKAGELASALGAES